MSVNRAILVDHGVPGHLAVRDVPMPAPMPSEAIVRVAALSLNRGETRRAMEAADGWRPGWDLAGVVAQAAADGSGPQQGARVVGLMPSGAWATHVAVPTNTLAVLPNAVPSPRPLPSQWRASQPCTPSLAAACCSIGGC
jgi:NADPH:quinone reductase-like Zn-dependent oxidoreductase